MADGKVLVFDDDALVRWSLKERLAREGCDVLEAAGSVTVPEHARKGVDVVLLDFYPADADSLAALERVKDLYPDAFVILMTAHSPVDHAAEAIAAGAFECIDKPFDVDQVARLVNNARSVLINA